MRSLLNKSVYIKKCRNLPENITMFKNLFQHHVWQKILAMPNFSYIFSLLTCYFVYMHIHILTTTHLEKDASSVTIAMINFACVRVINLYSYQWDFFLGKQMVELFSRYCSSTIRIIDLSREHSESLERPQLCDIDFAMLVSTSFQRCCMDGYLHIHT